MKKTILTDLDDVLLDSTLRFVKEINKIYGINSNLMEIEDAGLIKFAQKYGLSAKELYQRYSQLLCEENFALSIPEVPEASQYLSKLRKRNPNINIQIVTGRPSESKQYTEDSLKQKGISYNGLFFTNQDADSSLSSNTVKTKDDLVEILKPKVVLEDSPRLIQKTLGRAMNGEFYVVLFNRPWTRNFLNEKNLEREVRKNPNILVVEEPYWKNAYSFLSRILGSRDGN